MELSYLEKRSLGQAFKNDLQVLISGSENKRQHGLLHMENDAMTAIRQPLFLFLIILLCNTGYAQVSKFHTWNLSVGADALFPENNFKKTHGQGFGITGKAEYLFARHTSVIFSTGIYTVNGKTNLLNPDGKAATTIPVKIGGRYYLGNFYIGGETGWLYQQGFKPNNGFLYSFFLGDELITQKNGNSLDISLRHEAWVTDETRAFVGLRLAYEFRLR